MKLCVVPEKDAGAMTMSDAGTRPGPDASVEVDGGSDAGSADSGVCVPSIELCNGIDDDCDGFIDDMAMVSALDAGVIELDGGVALANGMCTFGIGACANTGMTSCVAGALRCNAIPAMPGVERCNNIDDDCDGQTDENDPGICSVTGQTCNGGACACPSGQSVCNGACKVLSAEICDGQDNDCNGQVDEGVTITCIADPDDDGYATGGATSQQCADATRVAQGTCPVGFVATSLGADCNSGDSSKWRQVSSRADGDTDTYCLGPATDDCVGAGPLAGRRFATSCAATDDCSDTNANAWRLMTSRTDADNDTYCTGAAAMDCVGNAALPGRRFSSTCAVTDDCSDTSSGIYRLASTRADADGDSWCTGNATMECIGGAPPAGRRYATSCQAFGFETVSTDCSDSNAAIFNSRGVRPDADGDGYCAATTTTECVGSAPPAGKRFAELCAGTDCRDTNPNATTTCSMPAAYGTTAAMKQCGVGHANTQNFTVTVNRTCQAGFQYVYGTSSTGTAYSGDPGGLCVATSGTAINMACGNLVFGQFTCSIVGSCEAI